MKNYKRILVPVLFAVSLSLASCKKSYQCDCNLYDSNGKYISTSSSKYKEYTRDKARDACEKKSLPDKICVIVN